MSSMTRRTALRGAAAGATFVAATALGACGKEDGGTEVAMEEQSPASETGAKRTLVAFFSRPGENYYYGDQTDLEIGNTAVLAAMIVDRIDCDVYEIKAAEPYSSDYDATVARNVREQDSDARPAIDGDLPSVEGYDTILIGSPIWNVQPPMIMRSFAEPLDLRGKRVIPFVTYAVSGLGSTEREYREACDGADVGTGLAVLGETVKDGGPDVDRWLAQIGLAASR